MKLILRHALSLAACVAPVALSAHESFLPLYHHSGRHEHGGPIHEAEPHPETSGKESHVHHAAAHTEERFALATGAHFTRYATGGDDAHLWELGLGVDYAIVPWLHVGGEASYGWFDSAEGSDEGWLVPSAHLDLHLPLGGAWEIVAGLEIGFPGGEESLVGDHWEWIPHLEVRFDPGSWFVEAGGSLAMASGETEHDEHDADEHEAAGEHDDATDFHEIVDPHGEREFHYFGVAGIRLLSRRLTLESQVSGVHVLSDDTAADNYLRAGVRVSYEMNERMVVSAGGSVPITDAERNQWEASAGLRFSF